MRNYWIFIIAIFVAGCATQRRAATIVPNAPAAKPLVREAAATRVVETRYEVRGYRDPDNPSVRHEAHAVYRTTRVPARVEALDTMPRSGFAPVSYAPLPPSTELTAELSAQKEITAELHAIQARMAAIEKRAQSQYGTLLNQTAETVNLRRRLEEERARVQDLESKLRGDVSANSSAAVVSADAPVTAEPKW